MKAAEYIALYEKYLSGTCTPEEEELLFAYRDQFELKESHLTSADQQQIGDRVKAKLLAHMEEHPVQGRPFIRRWFSIAATLVFLIGIGGFLVWHDFFAPVPRPVVQTASHQTVPPGVILQLADGKKIQLDQTPTGLLAKQGHTSITRNNNALVYQDEGQAMKADSVAYNTIYIPKGMQYHIILPDGSKVWLNATSTLTYPVRFSDGHRKVKLRGEAYFEIVSNKTQPFIVQSASQDIEVLGTTFNVSAYADDAWIKTTLVSGRIRLTPQTTHALGIPVTLSPGQQALLVHGQPHIQISPIDVAESISWMQQIFMFNDEPLTEAMKKISRWYPISIRFEGDVSGKRVGGNIPRYQDVHRLLDALVAVGVMHYKMKGKEVTIMP